jgi:hypothetical protein
MFGLGWGLFSVPPVIDGLLDFYAGETSWIIWEWSPFGCHPHRYGLEISVDRVNLIRKYFFGKQMIDFL